MTADIRPKWLGVTRSLQKAACRNNGIAVISSRIIVNDSGDPVTWTEPDVTKLGPLSSQDELIRLLAAHPSSAYREEYLLAKVLDTGSLVINKGSDSGVTERDWFILIDIALPYAILSVSELRERIAILKTMWVNRESSHSIEIGEPLYKIHW